MKDDLISRKAAIDLFPNDALEWDTNYGYIAPHFARRMIKDLPSAQQWIPVTERLPEHDGWYLICNALNKPWISYWYNGIDDDAYGWDDQRYFIKAWMPLPEPPEVEE